MKNNQKFLNSYNFVPVFMVIRVRFKFYLLPLNHNHSKKKFPKKISIKVILWSKERFQKLTK